MRKPNCVRPRTEASGAIQRSQSVGKAGPQTGRELKPLDRAGEGPFAGRLVAITLEVDLLEMVAGAAPFEECSRTCGLIGEGGVSSLRREREVNISQREPRLRRADGIDDFDREVVDDHGERAAAVRNRQEMLHVPRARCFAFRSDDARRELPPGGTAAAA